MELFLLKTIFFIVVFIIAAGILYILKKKFQTIKINRLNIIGTICIFGGLFNLYFGIFEGRISSLITGLILLPISYFLIKKGQTL
ncbi:hypothetical protein HOO31_07840 [Aliarcobacter cryaerophilus]|uniref:hypothetical protein n=1 Tax=Aliarcobacter cryaerophilus TaxID=28198 RepID=UPI00164A2F23|nr:hypothetical protein [Aliarcobacter cryaerophilus]QNK84553.1 hypothetical protein HOO31_07840 [Aliarcobacter cryaerophilus]